MNIQNGDMHYTMTLDNSQFEQSMRSSIGDVHLMQNAVLGLVQGMAALASVEGIKAFASKAFEMRTFFQDAEAAMKVFLKSDELAAEHLKELQSYAWYNVFDFTELVTASRQLQAFGTDVEDVIPVIDKLSNIAAATRTPLESLIEIYNKAKSVGSLDAMGVKSLGAMGVNVKETLKEMGEQADVTSISFSKLEKVINHLTDKEAGGMFAGLMDEQFNNLSSLKGALEDSLDTMFAHFGEDLQPTFEKILKNVQEFVAWIDDNRETLEKIAKTIITITGAYGIYKGALAAVMVAEKLKIKFSQALEMELALQRMEAEKAGIAMTALSEKEAAAAVRAKMTQTAMQGLNKALSTGVWTALIAVVIKLGVELNNFAKAQRRASDAASEAASNVTAEVEKERMEFNELVDTLELTEEGSDKYARTLDKLKKKYPELLEGMINERGILTDINLLREEGNRLLDDQIVKMTTSAKKQAALETAQDAFAESQKHIVESLKKSGLSEVEATKYANQLLRASQNVKYDKNNLYRISFLGVDSYVGRAKVSEGDTGWINVENILNEAFSKAGKKRFKEGVKDEIHAFANQYGQALEIIGTADDFERMMLEESTKQTGRPPKKEKASTIATNIHTLTKQINDLQKKSVQGLTETEKNTLKELQTELDNAKKEYKLLTGVEYDNIKKNADAAKKAARELSKIMKELADHEYDISVEAEQRRINNLEEGFEKEERQRQLNHQKNVANIERWGREEIEKYEEIDKKTWLAKHPKSNEEDFYRQYSGISPEDMYKVQSEMTRMREDEDARMVKENADTLKQMLANYGDYTEQQEQIDRKYVEDRKALEKQLTKDITEEQKQRIQDSITESKKMQSKESLELALGTVEATAYNSVVDKLRDVHKAYDVYFDDMAKAGATSAELTNILKEQEEAAGRFAQMTARADELVELINTAKKQGKDNGEMYDAWVAELQKLLRYLDELGVKLDKTTNRKRLKSWKEFKDSLTSSDFIEAGGQLGDVIANIGEAAENKAVAGFGQALSFAGDIGAKIASGDYLGAALSIITEIGNAIAEDIAKVNAFEKANEQAAQTANQINIDNLLGGENGIFGDNAVRQLANYLEAVDKAGKAINNLGLNATKNFKVLDRSAFANFFGGSDQYSSLGEFARKNGMDLLDAYGNINAQVLDLFKNTYEDLSDADKQWIDNAIAYTDQYAEAMEGLASYLQGIFGNTVDTIVDQIFEGSVDIHAITSELGKTMAKDLMQSLIMAAYFDDLEEKFKKILQDEGGMTESAMMQIYAMWSDRMAQFNEQLPMWEEMRDKWAQTLDFDTEAASIGAGTALASASQESIDLLNGQLNAMRTVQIRMDNRIGDILLEMRGFRGDVNTNHGETLQQLQQINTNTSERGLGRALGAYFG